MLALLLSNVGKSKVFRRDETRVCFRFRPSSCARVRAPFPTVNRELLEGLGTQAVGLLAYSFQGGWDDAGADDQRRGVVMSSGHYRGIDRAYPPSLQYITYFET